MSLTIIMFNITSTKLNVYLTIKETIVHLFNRKILKYT